MEKIYGKSLDQGYWQGVWVFMEQREGRLAPVSMELLGIGRQLAEKLEVELSGVLLGEDIGGLAEQVYAYGADCLYVGDSPLLRYYRTEIYARVFVQLVEKYRPEIILLGATTNGRDLAGAVATDLNTGLTADCTGLDIDTGQRLLLATRPAFGGNIMATIVIRKHRPQMATVRPKVLRMPAPQPGRAGKMIIQALDLEEAKMMTKISEFINEQATQFSLEEAEVIVAGGRGLKDKAGFRNICYGLAEVLGAKVGGSRAAVEAGWIEPKCQIGQTGVTVAPKIYFALGISGALQHLAGIRGSDIVVAVNLDPAAPIFSECTYGIIGDVFKIVPLLHQSLRELLLPTRRQSRKEDMGCV